MPKRDGTGPPESATGQRDGRGQGQGQSGKGSGQKKRFFNFIDVGIHDDFLDKHKKQEKEKYTRELKQLGL